jgi:hypothetical protein
VLWNYKIVQERFVVIWICKYFIICVILLQERFSIFELDCIFIHFPSTFVYIENMHVHDYLGLSRFMSIGLQEMNLI